MSKHQLLHCVNWAASLRTNHSGPLTLLALLLCGLATPASAGVWTEYLPGSSPYAQIAAGSTQVWALATNGDVYQYNSSTDKFDHITGNLVRIAVGTGKAVWGMNSAGETYQYNFSTKAFEKRTSLLGSSGDFGVIAAGGQGVWGLSPKNVTYEWDSVTKTFVKPPHGGVSGASGLYVGSYEIGVWELDASGNAWLYNTNTDTSTKPTESCLRLRWGPTRYGESPGRKRFGSMT